VKVNIDKSRANSAALETINKTFIEKEKIELLHMIKKGQLQDNSNYNSDFDKFLSLAA
jgi:hypothetical protein